MSDQQHTTDNTNNHVSASETETQKGSRKPRKTAEEKEQELREKMKKMQVRLARLEDEKKAEAKKKLDKLMQRVRMSIQSLGLEEVPAEEFENLLQDNADTLRQVSAPEA